MQQSVWYFKNANKSLTCLGFSLQILVVKVSWDLEWLPGFQRFMSSTAMCQGLWRAFLFFEKSELEMRATIAQDRMNVREGECEVKTVPVFSCPSQFLNNALYVRILLDVQQCRSGRVDLDKQQSVQANVNYTFTVILYPAPYCCNACVVYCWIARGILSRLWQAHSPVTFKVKRIYCFYLWFYKAFLALEGWKT